MATKSVGKNIKKTQPRIFKYSVSWEKEIWAQGWLTKNVTTEKNANQAFCKVCCKVLRAQAFDLKKHSEKSAHISGMQAVNTNKQKTMESLYNIHKDKDKKIVCLKMSVFIACHTSIRAIDHLSEVLKGSVPELKDFKVHRTKFSNIIKNVIAPDILRELVADIGDIKYSMIVDESTDVSEIKHLCICVKYFSCKRNQKVTEYLGIIELENASADYLYESVTNYCKNINLNILNMVGSGTDGGSNLCGKNHSLFPLLKKDIPNLQLVRCVCHALNNAASTASQEFPAAIEFLCREIYNWFHNSGTRRSSYQLTWNTLNNNVNQNEVEKTFHKFVKLSTTRWLARYNVIKVILEHYLELQTHFGAVIDSEKCYTSRHLNEMLRDNANFLYLVIIKPILYEINNLDLAFQKEFVDLGSAYDELTNTIILLARKLIKPTFVKDVDVIIISLDNELAFLPINEVDFGIEYYVALSKTTIADNSKLEVETRAFNYIKTLINQFCRRLPTNLEFYKNLQSVSPTICLNQTRPKFKDLPFLKDFVPSVNLGLVENQYNKLLITDWTKIFDSKTLSNSYLFWRALYVFKNTGGKFIFRELALFILTLLSLPSSNAVVERVFSIMNLTKTKVRNRTLTLMLDALLRIRLHLYANSICCQNFQPTDNMIKNFHYGVIYNSSASSTALEEKENIESSIDNF